MFFCMKMKLHPFEIDIHFMTIMRLSEEKGVLRESMSDRCVIPCEHIHDQLGEL